jgi:hypothetical protein
LPLPPNDCDGEVDCDDDGDDNIYVDGKYAGDVDGDIDEDVSSRFIFLFASASCPIIGVKC